MSEVSSADGDCDTIPSTEMSRLKIYGKGKCDFWEHGA